MNYNSFFPSNLEKVVKEEQQQIAEIMQASAEYHGEQVAAIFETRDILKKMQEDSKKDAITQMKRFIIQTILSIAALIAAVIAAVAAVIPLL